MSSLSRVKSKLIDDYNLLFVDRTDVDKKKTTCLTNAHVGVHKISDNTSVCVHSMLYSIYQ